MTLALADWMINTMWVIFGLMIIDFLIGFFRSFWEGTFNVSFLSCLKDILYYIMPLNFIVSLTPFDPTGWGLVIIYFVGGFSVILKYVLDIKRRFTKPRLEEQ